jgi:hypothetical protein
MTRLLDRLDRPALIWRAWQSSELRRPAHMREHDRWALSRLLEPARERST